MDLLPEIAPEAVRSLDLVTLTLMPTGSENDTGSELHAATASRTKGWNRIRVLNHKPPRAVVHPPFSSSTPRRARVQDGPVPGGERRHRRRRREDDHRQVGRHADRRAIAGERP